MPAAQDHRAAPPTGLVGPEVTTVLVVGTDDWAIEQGAEALSAGGFEVLRCHEPGEPAFPCNALREGGVCPLDVGFEAVVSVRSRPAAPLPFAEFGAVCGVHAGAKLLVAGISSGNPLAPWAAGEIAVTDDLPTAVRRVAPSVTVDLRGQD